MKKIYIVFLVILGISSSYSLEEGDFWCLLKLGLGYVVIPNNLPPEINSGISYGGVGLNGAFYFGNPENIQFGLEIAYLNVASFMFSDYSYDEFLMSITVNMLFHVWWFFIDIGTGLGIDDAIKSYLSYSTAIIYSSFLFKAGVGLTIPITKMFGINVGATGYLPINIKLYGSSQNPLIINIGVGCSFNI